MKKNYIILLAAIFFSGIMIAQEAQKNFINYQGVARNGADQLMANESMTIGIALKMGSATGASAYAENHSVTTDANGVFSLKIGNGESVSGAFNTIPWGSEATFVTVLVNGSEIGTTEMMAVPYALSSGDGSQSATEVPYDNAVSGLTATNAQEAIDELAGSGAVDADADPTNEFQTLSFDAITNELSLTDGNSITIPTGGTDGDADATNEIQNLTLAGTNLEISGGTGVDLAPLIPPGGTDDQNASEVPFDNSTSTLTATDTQAAIEELAAGGTVDTDDQDLSLSGTMLQISDGAGVDLAPIIPPGGTDDQNAGEVPYDNTASPLVATNTQAAIDELAGGGLVDTDDQALILTGDILTIEDGAGSIDLSAYGGASDLTAETGLLTGDGTTISGLVGTADNQVAKWDNTAGTWVAGTDETGGFTLPYYDEVSGASASFHIQNENPGEGYGVMGSIGEGAETYFPVTRAGVLGVATLGHGVFGMSETDDYAGVYGASFSATGVAVRGNNSGGGVGGHFSTSATGVAALTTGEGNVGIGTGTPTAKLDVNGGIRSNDLSGAGQRNVMADADGNLVIGAGGGGSSLWGQNGDKIHYNTGNVGLGTDDPEAPLDIALESFISINTTSANATNYMQFNNSTGAVGYSGIFSNGRDMDFGTNGSNRDGKVHLTTRASPKLTVAANGDVGIGTTSPTAKLDVTGDIKTTGEINRTATGNANMIPIAYGKIYEDGNIDEDASTSNFIVEKSAQGSYFITIPEEEDPDSWTVLVNVISSFPAVATVLYSGAPAYKRFYVRTSSMKYNREGNLDLLPSDLGFSFVAYKK